MSDIVVSVIPSTAQRVAAQLGGMNSYLQRFSRDLLFSEAANSANAFIRFTPPIPKGGGDGRSAEAKKQGEIAVERDIRSFLMPADKSLDAAVQSAVTPYENFLKWKAGPAPRGSGRIAHLIHADQDVARAWQKAKNIAGKSKKFSNGGYPLENIAEIRQFHDEIRKKYRGRITNQGGPPIMVQAKPFSADKRHIDRYIAMRQKAVGVLSNYWWSIILQVPPILIKGVERAPGRTGIMAWVKRHRRRGLLINKVGKVASTESSITMISPIGDIYGVSRDARTKANVIKFRKNANAGKPWQRILDQAILTANRGGKPT